MSLCKKTVSLSSGSHVPIQKNRVPIRRGPCTRDFLVQGLLEDPGSRELVENRWELVGRRRKLVGMRRESVGIRRECIGN